MFLFIFFFDIGILYLPVEMLEIEWVKILIGYGSFVTAAQSLHLKKDDLLITFFNERIKHDFEFWAAVSIKILEKDSFRDIPIVLRLAQRIL